MTSSASKPVGKLCINVNKGIDLKDTAVFGTQSPFVEASIGNDKFNSSVVNNGGVNPTFDYTFLFNLDGSQSVAKLVCKAKGTVSDTIIGRLDINIEELLKKSGPQTYNLVDPDVFTKVAGGLSLTCSLDDGKTKTKAATTTTTTTASTSTATTVVASQQQQVVYVDAQGNIIQPQFAVQQPIVVQQPIIAAPPAFFVENKVQVVAAAPAISLAPLYVYKKTGDFMTCASATGISDALSHGYVLQATDCKILAKQVKGTIPLSLYYSSKRKEYLTTAGSEDAMYAQQNDYTWQHDEGYIYPKEVQGTVQLRRYLNAKTNDNFTTASTLVPEGYKCARNLGWVYPAK